MFVVMICCSFTQMTVVALGTALLANFNLVIAVGSWALRVGTMYAVKLARRDFMYNLPIRGFGGVLVAACLSRPSMLLVSDFAFFIFGRHPFEMGNGQWWSGRVWGWLLLVVAIALHAQPPHPEPPLTNGTLSTNQSIELLLQNATPLSEPLSATAPWFVRPDSLAAFAALLFMLWLVSHLAFFHLCKRESWKSFRTTHTAAAYVRLQWEAAESDAKRARLLVKLHPAVLRLISADARLWIEAHWRECSDDRPSWMTDRWLRSVPNSMLPKKVLKALGGKSRRRSTLKEELELLSDHALPTPGPATLDAYAVPSDSGDHVVDGSTEHLRAAELLAVVPDAGS
jgi:hypothetical protein